MTATARAMAAMSVFIILKVCKISFGVFVE